MAVTTERHSLTFGAHMKLPPIKELSANSPVKSSKKVNSFRRDSSRVSIESSVSSSVTSEPLVFSSHQSSMVSNRRRFSAIEQRHFIDLTKSDKVMRNVDQRRRCSMMLNPKRTSFGTVGKQVTALLRAKNAFVMFRKRTTQFEDQSIENDKAFEIDKMPSQPRFASTLSAEAQYAIMKGYEDVVYSNLCTQYPEYRTMLRRNRTPHTGIKVSNTKGKQKDDTESPRSTEENDESKDTIDGDMDNTMNSANNVEPASTSTPKPEETPSCSPWEDKAKSAISTADQSPRDILSGSPRSRSKFGTDLSNGKARSLSEKHNKKKQLVMTYRYQRAMDILDNLREHQGLHVLSPRVKGMCLEEPLKEYNTWSYVWTHEFEPKNAKALTRSNII